MDGSILRCRLLFRAILALVLADFAYFRFRSTVSKDYRMPYSGAVFALTDAGPIYYRYRLETCLCCSRFPC
jgi:hypothetical protein